ncbi:MAG: 2-oxo-4-hydroxy-4-carboxy-5-ureidoimidazoline decarboxylase [Leptolyngbya sp. SIO3F4]|nr:2-oxo-4-hydroxy-4-carboxy-5-ureidoimidazoline decarboxylase [Leptolyngbya sp. SIO3F4]
MVCSITDLNQMTQAEFVTALGSVFEDTPGIAKEAWHQRPFLNVDHLRKQMVTLVAQMPEAAQLELIRAHPDLGSRVQMAPASVQEQTSVGLDCLSPSEYKQFQILNETYKKKFNFPFVMAVKGQTKEAILTKFAERLQNTLTNEQQQALIEIGKIAGFRLNDLIK